MAWYNPFGKCAEVFRRAREGKIELFSPDSVKEEIVRVFGKYGLGQEEIEEFLNDFPISWVDKEIYTKLIDKTKVKHKPDKPIEALSLILECGILSADKHFKNRADINELLRKLEK